MNLKLDYKIFDFDIRDAIMEIHFKYCLLKPK